MRWDTKPAVKKPKAKVYLGVPTHDGRVQNEVVNAFLYGGDTMGAMTIEGGSALTYNFNSLYCMALNNRKNGFTHFAMLHSDIAVAMPGWCDKMVEIMEREVADVVSVVMPLKKVGEDLTSTAIEELDGTKPLGFVAKKLTLRECAARGKTWSDPALLVNTGLMLVDIRKAWATKVWFEFQDRIESVLKGGIETFYPVSLAEDFGFSRMVRAEGGKLVVTQEVTAYHCGGGRFSNQTLPLLLPAVTSVV